MEAELQLKRYHVLQARCPKLSIDRNARKFKPFVADAWIVRGVKSQGNPSNGSLHAAEKVICLPSKVPLIFHQLQPNLVQL